MNISTLKDLRLFLEESGRRRIVLRKDKQEIDKEGIKSIVGYWVGDNNVLYIGLTKHNMGGENPNAIELKFIEKIRIGSDAEIKESTPFKEIGEIY